MQSEGRTIHQQALNAQEKGDFTQALKLEDEAMVVYQQAGDQLGFAEIQAMRFLTLRHLFEKTNNKGYLILAKHAAQVSVELAKESGDKNALAIPLYNLAKAHEALGELSEACQSYQQALDELSSNPDNPHYRPAVLVDMKVHLTTCEYKSGDKSALDRAEQAMTELETAEGASDYERGVWVSGGHMSIADMLRGDNPQKAKEHLQKAKDIIDANPDLKLRKEQWEKLAETFK